jgi:hypothetical protein
MVESLHIKAENYKELDRTRGFDAKKRSISPPFGINTPNNAVFLIVTLPLLFLRQLTLERNLPTFPLGA